MQYVILDVIWSGILNRKYTHNRILRILIYQFVEKSNCSTQCETISIKYSKFPNV